MSCQQNTILGLLKSRKVNEFYTFVMLGVAFLFPLPWVPLPWILFQEIAYFYSSLHLYDHVLLTQIT